jgi:hypothetical protein
VAFSIRIRSLVAALLGVSLFVGAAFAEVSVRGYTRKDGTYVRPHRRTDPDGNFDNNWSTIGNTNPYTGEPGTKRRPPAGYGRGGHSSTSGGTRYSDDGESYYAPMKEPEKPKKSKEVIIAEREAKKKRDEQTREGVATKLRDRGVEMNWQQHTSFELHNAAFRLAISDQLGEEGLAVDWKNMEAVDLNETKNRVLLAKEIAKHGVDLSWQDFSADELHDMLGRIKLAEYMRNVHPSRQRVDWRKYSLQKLSKMTSTSQPPH